MYITIKDHRGKYQTIVSNKVHPFFAKVDTTEEPEQSAGHDYTGHIPNAYWINAEHLKAGYKLLGENNHWQEVQQITIQAEKLQAFNLTVANDHTYFIKGTSPNVQGVWVHNDCWLKLPENAKPVKGKANHYEVIDGNGKKQIVMQTTIDGKTRYVTENHQAGDPAFNKNNQRVNEKTGRYEASGEVPISELYGRPYLRKETTEKIMDNYQRLPNGDYLEKSSREIIKGPIDIGHVYGWEHRRLVLGADELKLTMKEFYDYVNARPAIFRFENRSDNRSHKWEKPGRDDIQDIKDDMSILLKKGN